MDTWGQHRPPSQKKRETKNRMRDYSRVMTPEEITRSIQDVRRAYKELTDEQFVEFYLRRYGSESGTTAARIQKVLGDMQP